MLVWLHDQQPPSFNITSSLCWKVFSDYAVLCQPRAAFLDRVLTSLGSAGLGALPYFHIMCELANIYIPSFADKARASSNISEHGGRQVESQAVLSEVVRAEARLIQLAVQLRTVPYGIPGLFSGECNRVVDKQLSEILHHPALVNAALRQLVAVCSVYHGHWEKARVRGGGGGGDGRGGGNQNGDGQVQQQQQEQPQPHLQEQQQAQQRQQQEQQQGGAGGAGGGGGGGGGGNHNGDGQVAQQQEQPQPQLQQEQPQQRQQQRQQRQQQRQEGAGGASGLAVDGGGGGDENGDGQVQLEQQQQQGGAGGRTAPHLHQEGVRESRPQQRQQEQGTGGKTTTEQQQLQPNRQQQHQDRSEDSCPQGPEEQPQKQQQQQQEKQQHERVAGETGGGQVPGKSHGVSSRSRSSSLGPPAEGWAGLPVQPDHELVSITGKQAAVATHVARVNTFLRVGTPSAFGGPYAREWQSGITFLLCHLEYAHTCNQDGGRCHSALPPGDPSLRVPGSSSAAMMVVLETLALRGWWMGVVGELSVVPLLAVMRGQAYCMEKWRRQKVVRQRGELLLETVWMLSRELQMQRQGPRAHGQGGRGHRRGGQQQQQRQQREGGQGQGDVQAQGEVQQQQQEGEEQGDQQQQQEGPQGQREVQQQEQDEEEGRQRHRRGQGQRPQVRLLRNPAVWQIPLQGLSVEGYQTHTTDGSNEFYSMWPALLQQLLREKDGSWDLGKKLKGWHAMPVWLSLKFLME